MSSLAVRRKLAFVLERALAYRINIYLLTFLLVLLPFRHPYGARAYLTALSFASLMAFIYLANKVTDKNEDSINVHAGAIPDSSRPFTLYLAWFLAIAPFVYLMARGEFSFLAVYLVVLVLGYLYSFPTSLFGRRFRFKQILFLKTITSSLIWALPTAGVYTALVGSINMHTIVWFALIFCIGASMEVMWDIRDTKGDSQFDIHTIANTFGVSAARVLSITLLVIAAAMAYTMDAGKYTFLALALSAPFALYVREGRHSLFFHTTAFLWILATGFDVWN